MKVGAGLAASEFFTVTVGPEMFLMRNSMGPYTVLSVEIAPRAFVMT